MKSVQTPNETNLTMNASVDLANEIYVKDFGRIN